MKANELMIGDWVKITPLNKIGKIYRVDVANGNGNGYTAVIDGDYHEDNLEPIPLTPEILEKNGFKHIERIPTMDSEIGTWRSNKLGGATIKKYLIGIEKTVFCLIAGHSKIGDIYHLHELQHALRLCGIKKEITL